MTERNCCIGKCCTGFTMSATREERQKSIDAENRGETVWVDAWGRKRGLLKDECVPTQFIQDMLIPAGKNEDGKEIFDCQHFDTARKSCTVYENRPGLCRRYPDRGAACDHVGCTFKNE